jgi:hypothetical protein
VKDIENVNFKEIMNKPGSNDPNSAVGQLKAVTQKYKNELG